MHRGTGFSVMACHGAHHGTQQGKLWHALAAPWHPAGQALAPSKASHGMPWQPHGTHQGMPWHPPGSHPQGKPRRALAPPMACHGTPKGRPWHATNLGFVVPTGMARHPSTKAGRGMPWHPPKAGQGTDQGRPWHATNLCLWCPWACHGTPH